jgi:hypothetical protein
MAIQDKQEIENVVRTLEARDAHIYHACQLKDFRSYLKLGGIPSRNKLLNSNLEFTTFDTDKIDKNNNVWDKVFGNFSDFGREFTKEFSRSQPNPYGPIQIVLNSNALRSATDLSITLRSAGARDFDRDRECLKNTHEFNMIFQHIDPTHAPTASQRKSIAFANELNTRFVRNNSSSPEFNCVTPNELLNLNNAIYIIVDSCIYKNRYLMEEVKNLTNIKVIARSYYHPDKEAIIKELSNLSATFDCKQQPLTSGSFASDKLKRWVADKNEFHYNRFISYLTSGTTRA